MPVAIPLAIGGAAAIGAGAQIWSANRAAAAQTSAAKRAMAFQSNIYGQNRQTLMPFIRGGETAFNNLIGELPDLTKPFDPTMARLAQTPGYQFALSQGERATQNANTAMGWGASGPGAKGLTNYAEGLASQTFQQQFADYWAQQQQRYGMMEGPASLGMQAATGLAGVGAQTGAQVGQQFTNMGQAIAGGAMATGNAISNAAGTAASGYAFFGPGGLYGPGGAYQSSAANAAAANPLAATSNPLTDGWDASVTRDPNFVYPPGYSPMY